MSKLQAEHKSLSEAQYIPQIGFGQKGKRKLFMFHTFWPTKIAKNIEKFSYCVWLESHIYLIIP